MKRASIVILLIGMTSVGFTVITDPAQMTFIEDEAKGTLTLYDGRVEVLTYRFSSQLKQGVDPKYTRSCYIHPLYSLDGTVLTDDFPRDHLHHHGVFWTWPVVKTRGHDTQTWHPDTPSLLQHFARWLKREVKNGAASLSVENLWKLDDNEVVAKETVTLDVLPTDDAGRAIDMELVFQAVGGPLELQGSQDQNKGYGGLCIRGAPVFKGAALTTDQGLLEKDSTNMPFRWADMSTEELGVAIFVSPDHPGFPSTWLIRNSYAGVLNVSWPGLKPAVLLPDRPVSLRYRLYVHRGDATAGRVQQAYGKYLSLNQKQKSR
jgi:hypothetical protein